METTACLSAYYSIHTVPEAERDHEDFKTKNKQNNLDVYNDDDFNYAELEKIMQNKG